MRSCSKCARVNADSAVICQCGHAFDEVAGAEAHADTFEPLSKPQPSGPPLVDKFVAVIGGFVVGYLAWVAVLGIFTVRLGAGLGVFTGLAGVFIALQRLRRKYQARSEPE